MITADEDVIDEVVAFCQSKGVNPKPFLAMGWHESAGLTRSITGTNPDGSVWKAFPGGDMGNRDIGYGPRSFGAFQIYAVVHGPFLPGTRNPDWRAANLKWDNVTTSMNYLWDNAPYGGWGATYAAYGGDAAYEADPEGFLFQWVHVAQGSIDWNWTMARNAHAAAEDLYANWLARHSQPQPEPEPQPEPQSDTTITDEITAINQRVDAIMLGLDTIRVRLDGLEEAIKRPVVIDQTSLDAIKSSLDTLRDNLIGALTSFTRG